ncbi:hypothetical protein [Desulfobacula sp.]|uniref:hypothetical protein n=1 Tax=Desulfobacula sp. TaxID=2593537 RepID=UPI001DFD1BB1|nr:hypothetical protein [Desulfobacula sp.]
MSKEAVQEQEESIRKMVRELSEEEQKDEKYKGHDKMLDVDNSKTFGQYEFLECCQKMGIVKDISNGS